MWLSCASWLLLGSFIPASSAVPSPTPLSTESIDPKHFVSEHASNKERQRAVKEAFNFSWRNYAKYAMPHDSLRPLDKSYEDDRNGWGVTAVDALSTAIIMHEKETVNEILEFIKTIDFTTTAKENELISLFESTIRYIGGLISAYDLLNGPYKSLVSSNPSSIKILLDQAESLAKSLSVAFTTPTGVPDGIVVFNPTYRKGGYTTNSIAGTGTLVLEWTRLSDLLSEDTYANLTQHAEKYLLNPKPESGEPFPGLVGTQVSLETGDFVDSRGGWGASSDSFYEYLIKMYVYDPVAFEEYKDRWVLAADSSIKYLASHPSTREDLTFLSKFSNRTTDPTSGHLDCFSGANFILGGLVLENKSYTDFGLKLAESCYHTYASTPTGIGPEAFRWIDAAESSSQVPAQYAAFYLKSGFWPTSSVYILRPETLESVYYAYRATRDTKWQDRAWDAFLALNESCRVEGGFAGLRDVMDATRGYTTKMESFWLAETLKYLYLTFLGDDGEEVHVDGKGMRFVFNTEAHPLQVRNFGRK
ncbi:hypothetical protein FALCPG4_017082 [Fusarium falciforme]